MTQIDPVGDQTRWREDARVLLLDDEPANLEFMLRVLEPEGYGALLAFSDPLAAADRLKQLNPDLVVLDIVMPHLDGFGFLAHMRRIIGPGRYLPALVVTADPAPDIRRRALSAGAKDFMTKPLSPAELRLRVRNLLETRYLHEQLRVHNELLEHRVEERTRELEEARLDVLYRLARAAEYRDDQTGRHTLRVGRLSGRLAQVLGLPTEAHELLRRAAPLHDIGKIGIPDSILLKPERLDAAEIVVMQTHTVIGANILAGSRHPLLRLAEEVAISHHERWDGAGYPNALRGADIPVAGRIVAVADVFDSLTHERPYKHAWSIRDALTEIESEAGAQFDPQVVEALLRVGPEIPVLQAEAAEQLPRAVAPDSVASVLPPLPAPYDGNDAQALVERIHDLVADRDRLSRELRQLNERLAALAKPGRRASGRRSSARVSM
ncbi:MAG TPA: HD domain-containing phosphohydrolase [Longimicrobiales bacterium]|nr:HD domain-containing phosphohydrolase [Longimicrobiales bacterium]